MTEEVTRSHTTLEKRLETIRKKAERQAARAVAGEMYTDKIKSLPIWKDELLGGNISLHIESEWWQPTITVSTYNVRYDDVVEHLAGPLFKWIGNPWKLNVSMGRIQLNMKGVEHHIVDSDETAEIYIDVVESADNKSCEIIRKEIPRTETQLKPYLSRYEYEMDCNGEAMLNEVEASSTSGAGVPRVS